MQFRYLKGALPMNQNRQRVVLALVVLAAGGCGSERRSTPLDSATPAPILLFNGSGTSHNDVAQFERLLSEQHLDYSLVNSADLNDMSEARLRSTRLLVVPGGNYIDMGHGLLPATMTKVREAVHQGVNYLGVCAGGLLAGDAIRGSNNFNLTNGVAFDFYAAVRRGVHKEAVAISARDAGTLDHYWEDGPQFTGWGAVAAKYPDGTPAVVQAPCGEGWVVLCGTHPEAPASWRRGLRCRASAAECNAYAVTLIRAALERTRLPEYESP
jgi:glutamine amidotransferase-like uncharacterized protein